MLHLSAWLARSALISQLRRERTESFQSQTSSAARAAMATLVLLNVKPVVEHARIGRAASSWLAENIESDVLRLFEGCEDIGREWAGFIQTNPNDATKNGNIFVCVREVNVNASVDDVLFWNWQAGGGVGRGGYLRGAVAVAAMPAFAGA